MSISLKILRFTLYAVFTLLLLLAAIVLYIQIFIEDVSVSQAAPSTTEFVTTPDETIAYRKWAGTSSRTVVFVGGLSAWADTWEKTVLAQQKRGSTDTFVAIDLPPFGYSTPQDKSLYYRDVQAKRIAAVIREVSSGEVILVGHSYGGGPVAELMLTDPTLVDGVVLISPVLNLGATKKSPPPPVLTIDWLREGVLTIALRIEPLLLNRLKSFVFITDNISYETLRLYTQPTNVEGTSQRLSDWIFDYATDPVDTYVSSQPDAYMQTQIPLHLIWGEEDTLTPISDATPLLTNKSIILKPLVGVGHIPMLENVDYFNDVLAESLKQL